jgi:hypothetical protein
MAKVTKTALAIATMNENASLPMEQVIPLISAASGVPLNIARNYYLWAVRKGLAAGTAPGRTAPVRKAAKVKPTKEVPAKKLLKEVGLKATVKAKPEKSPEEVARIKEANLARMREVSAKQKKYNQVARPQGPGVPDFDADAARAEVAEFMEHGDDSFTMPKFLTKDAVKALV